MRWRSILAGLVACATPAAPVTALKEARHASCDETEIANERLVVDWSPLDRSRLEAAARHGLVPIRVDGCRARMVDGCSIRRPYSFMGTTRQREVLRLSDRDEIDATLPVLGTRFGASLDHARSLDVAMTVIGRYEANDSSVARSDLDGDCEGVTHVIASLSVGAFEIATAESLGVGAHADFARASHASAREHLDAAGEESACAKGRWSDATPPENCGIPLRIELRAFRADRHATLAAKPAESPPPPATPEPEAMQRALDGVRKELAVCHHVARATTPEMNGSLTLTVKLAKSGNVRSVGTKPEGVLDDNLGPCAIERVGHIHFPASDDDRPRLVVIPVLFRPLEK